jgi:hypothetical protein
MQVAGVNSTDLLNDPALNDIINSALIESGNLLDEDLFAAII